MPIGDLAGEIALVIGAAVVLVVAVTTPRRHQWVGAPIALATCVTSATLVASRMATTPQKLTFDGAWAIDDVAGWAELVVLGVTAITVLLSPEWFATDARHGEWYSLLLLSAAGALVMASATDTSELVLGVLLSSSTGYVLASYHRRSALSVEAGAKYFLVGALTNALLLAGAAVLFGVAGTTLYTTTASAASSGSSGALAAAAVLMVIGLGFKVASFPAHSWLPDVAQGAPAPAAAFLTVAPKVGAVVALARVLTLIPDDAFDWRPIVAVVAAITMTLGNLSALGQDDVRRLLGWSSVSQAGYALMALPALGHSSHATSALVFFLASYAVGQMAAFAVIVELRGRTAIEDYRGLAGSRPWLAATLTVSFLSFVGIPPLAGFAGKLMLFVSTIDAGYAWLAAIAVANSVLSLVYYLRVIVPMDLRTSDRPVAVLGWWSAVAAYASLALVVALGVGAQPLLDAMEGARLLP